MLLESPYKILELFSCAYTRLYIMRKGLVYRHLTAQINFILLTAQINFILRKTLQ
jgi:hypothetical protein